MRQHQIADLITLARAYDDRIEEVADPWWDEEAQWWVKDARLEAWHLVLGELDFELAARGLTELYRSPQMMRLQPGHIYEAAERVRARNVAAADTSRLIPPDGLENEDGTTRHADWMKAALHGIGRGMSPEQAQDYADEALQVSRRMLGPSRPRPLEAALRTLEGRRSA